jgi:hypothetical protein
VEVESAVFVNGYIRWDDAGETLLWVSRADFSNDTLRESVGVSGKR